MPLLCREKGNQMNRSFSRTLTIKDIIGHPREVKVKLEDTNISNFKLIVTDDESEMPVGVKENERIYLLGDRVKVTGDCKGYICPGINRPGMGTIVKIMKDNADHFYMILMDNNERGFAKSARITVVS